jgi:uncharacterized damage-inducible protein DinB
MKSILVVTLLLACALTGVAQTKPAEGPKDWLDQWQIATGQLLGVAEAMPADKYGFKPVKEVEPFGEQIKHTIGAMKVLLANAQGEKQDVPKLFGELGKLKTKDEIVAEFRKTVDAGTTVFNKIAGKNDGEVVESQFFGKTTRRFLLLQAIAHNNNHYGQLTVHLRLNGITPPASRR